MYKTESDVEQQFIYPLLTSPTPDGLGYARPHIKTKANIKRLTIDKGNSKKLYYPDYAVVVEGVPVLIVEAKAPGEDLEEAFREARLYATEINATYSNGLNPCSRILATDGIRVIAGYWDQIKYVVDLPAESIAPLEKGFDELAEFVGSATLTKAAREVLRTASHSAEFVRPTSQIGGKSVAEETVGENSFGANISVEYKYLFNPESTADRERIVRNAYVTSRRRMSHVGPIDRIIRAAIPPHIHDAREISDLKKPTEITNQLRRIAGQSNELCLLIGSVGSGKSTFTDYLRIEALPSDLIGTTAWVSLNLNLAPLSKEKIYDWILDELIRATKQKFPDVDFDDLSFLRKVYSAQLSRVEKGRAALFPVESEQFRQAIFDELKRVESDRLETARAFIDFFYKGRGKHLIVVLDNCDKRGREDQLLMFEVATWLKDRLSCTIFLPLRDTTYDQYRSEPPLDTVIKDLVFRIDPPLLEQVIYARLKYAVREIAASSSAFVYHLPNGMRVDCKREDVGDYLKSIVASLFQDGFFRRIITGLAGRNVRRGLEIVLDFCKSGYINEAEILKIRSSDGEHKIPNHLISKILLKGQRRYYSDASSGIRNLFFATQDDALPNPFIRISILQWLRERRSEYGPNRTKGFHQVNQLVTALEEFGFSAERVLHEVQVLSDAECIDSESQGSSIDSCDLITIAPAGFIHLELISDVNYLSAVAEDVLFDSRDAARRVADNMVGRGVFPADSRQAALSSSVLLLDFLERYRAHYLIGEVRLVSEVRPTYLEVIADAREKVARLKDNDKAYRAYEGLLAQYPPGAQEAGQVVSVQHYGFFVDFGARGHGLVHRKNFNGFGADIETGDWVLVEVIKYDVDRRRFDLKLIDK